MTHWAAPGIECQCIHEGDWYGSVIECLLGLPQPGPAFMQILKIKDTLFISSEFPDHEVKLTFEEFPGNMYCACGFVPLQKIEDEVEQSVTAPVTREHEKV